MNLLHLCLLVLLSLAQTPDANAVRTEANAVVTLQGSDSETDGYAAASPLADFLAVVSLISESVDEEENEESTSDDSPDCTFFARINSLPFSGLPLNGSGTGSTAFVHPTPLFLLFQVFRN
ncbi:MAG: hypothetical protein RIC19_18110 [Phaeodactylibacter sp.]|uniref:hypothetical protein n=1 Tax=Phaeodactylibacter sp. TaxID=1940289 RepID=UPI0032EC6515